MLTRDSKTASLYDMARLWAHQLQQPDADVQTLLLRAIWSGDLRLRNRHGPLTTRELILLIQKTQPHPGISIVSDETEIPPAQQWTDDGGMIVYLDHFVVLPEQKEPWTDEIVGTASAALIEAEAADFSDKFLAAVMPLSLDRDEVADWCTASSHPWPSFWLQGTQGTEKKQSSGRPSMMAKIKLQLRRRAEAGTMKPTLRREAEELAEWADRNLTDPVPVPQSLSIENAIRRLYWDLKEQGARTHKT
jgi:hypothetical protein